MIINHDMELLKSKYQRPLFFIPSSYYHHHYKSPSHNASYKHQSLNSDRNWLRVSVTGFWQFWVAGQCYEFWQFWESVWWRTDRLHIESLIFFFWRAEHNRGSYLSISNGGTCAVSSWGSQSGYLLRFGHLWSVNGWSSLTVRERYLLYIFVLFWQDGSCNEK